MWASLFLKKKSSIKFTFFFNKLTHEDLLELKNACNVEAILKSTVPTRIHGSTLQLQIYTQKPLCKLKTFLFLLELPIVAQLKSQTWSRAFFRETLPPPCRPSLPPSPCSLGRDSLPPSRPSLPHSDHIPPSLMLGGRLPVAQSIVGNLSDEAF